MATGSKAVYRDVRTLFRDGVIGTLSDVQLLERFLASHHDEAEDAFAAVVQRHGPMVYRVCRRILMDPNDADDAFQVTFLVLARRFARSPDASGWPTGFMASPYVRRRRCGRAQPTGGLGRGRWTARYATGRRRARKSTNCGS